MATAKQFPVNGVRSAMLGGKHIHTPINPAKLAAEVRDAFGLNLNTDPFNPGPQHGSPEIWRKPAGHPAQKARCVLFSYDAEKVSAVGSMPDRDEDPEKRNLVLRGVAALMLLESNVAVADGSLKILTAPHVVHERQDNYDEMGWNTPTFTDRVEMEVGYESDVCPRCECVLPREEEHWCSEIVLYEESRLPNATTEILTDPATGARFTRLVALPDSPEASDPRASVGILHATTFTPHGLDKADLKRLAKIVEDHRG